MDFVLLEDQSVGESTVEEPVGEIEELDPNQPFSPISATSDTVTAKKQRKGKKQIAADLCLLQATDALKPYQAPKRTMIRIWEKIADRVNETGSSRTAKYCRDRITTLLSAYRAQKNKKDPTGDGQQPEATEEELLLQSIDASEEEGNHMSETQKEKATEDQALIDRLEQDTLKSFAEKSHRVDPRKSDDEWEDDYARDKAQADAEAMGIAIPTTPSKKRAKGQGKWSPWKRNPGSARRAREDLFREKFRLDADSRQEELQDKKDERAFQREKFLAEKAERDEERQIQREKDQRADELRREEVNVQRQNSELLKDLVLSLVKKS